MGVIKPCRVILAAGDCLREQYELPLMSVVCFNGTYQNYLGTKHNFTKYLKESCWFASE